MSRYIATRAIRGAQGIVREAEEAVNAALADARPQGRHGLCLDHAAHARGDLPDSFHRTSGRILHGEDVIGDVLGCF